MTTTVTPAGTFADMTIDQIGDWLIAEARDAALTRLAAIALRRLRAEAAALLSQAIGRLAVPGRMADEAERVAAMLADATPPPDLSAAPVAPARGPMWFIPNFARQAALIRQPDGSRQRGVILARDGTRRGQRLDRLTLMCREAWLQHERKGGRPDAFRPPFDPGQIAMAARYQALTERHVSAGLRCASAEARVMAGGGAGGDGGFLVAYMDESREIGRIHASIGPGIALQVRRGAGRRDITIRALVDAVCIHGEDLTAVLRAHGWAKKTGSLSALRDALAAALDRMQGYHRKGS